VELKRSMSFQQSFFEKITNETKSILTASYVVANLVAKKWKPYSDGDIVKCMENVTDIIWPEKREIF